MPDLFQTFSSAYGEGFVYVFVIPAFLVGGILVFLLFESVFVDVRQWVARRGRDDEETAELDVPLSGFPRDEPVRRLRELHYRPLEPLLSNPFSKQVNRIGAEPHTWG